jgi:peptidoglycan DL-endopeptidase CwlO
MLTALLVAGISAPVAFAEPGEVATDAVEDQRARARDVQARIDANGARISALAEQLNGAQFRLAQIDAEIADAQRGIDDAQDEVDRRRSALNRRAASAYKRAGTGGPLDIMDVSDPAERNMAAKYASAVAASDANLVTELQAAQHDLEERKREHEEAREAAQAERDELAEKAATLAQANADQMYLLGTIDAEIQTILDEEQARRDAALVDLPVGSPPPPGAAPPLGPLPVVPTPPDPPPSTPPPPPTNRAQIAVDFAFAQLGKWYCWGGNGWGRYQPEFGINCPPDTYDCSGLTMRAWGAAGVTLPHYSGAQYSMFPRVPLNALRPGDLVFYGPGGSQHVGIYIGGGQMIEAPFTGVQVRVGSIYRHSGGPIGAVRPG